MSGSSGIPSDIPIRVTSGDSKQQLDALKTAFEQLNAEVGKFFGGFAAANVTQRQISSVTGSVRNLANLLKSNPQVAFLNAARTAGNQAVSAAQELSVQRALADQQRIGNALLSRDTAQLRTARRATERMIAEYQLRRTELSRQIGDIDRALETAPSFGKGSRGPGGARALRNLRSQLDSELNAIPQLLETAQQGASRIERALATTARQRRLEQGVARRQEGFYVREAFASTPEAQRIETRKLADQVVANLRRAREREEAARSRLFTRVDSGLARFGASQEAGEETLFANIRRNSLRQAASASNQQRRRDIADEAREETDIQRLRRNSILAAARASSAQRRREIAQEGALDTAVQRRLTGADAEAAILNNPAMRARLLSSLGLRSEANLEALTASLSRPGSASYGNRVRLGAINANIAQAVRLGQFDDASFQAREDEIARQRARSSLRQRQEQFREPGLRGEERTFQNVRNLDRLFGDGGGALFAIQGRLLLNYALLNQFQNAVVGAATAIAQFDNSLKNLQAISGSTGGEMEKLTKQIQDVALGTRFSVVELTQAATTMAQAGLGVQEIGASLNAVQLLATASGSELATAVDIATTALSVFRLRADELPRVADQMTAALNLSKLTIDQVALGFQYVGNTAADLGLSLTEVTAVLGTMANQGIRAGSTMGTGLRQLLVDLQDPPQRLRDRLRELGISMSQIDVRANGLTGVLENLRAAGFTSADAFATIELRAAAAFSALSRGTEDLTSLQLGITQANGAAQASAVQMESLINRFLQLRNTLTVIAAEAFAPFINVLKEMVSGLNSFLQSARGASDALQLMGSVVAGGALAGLLVFLRNMITSLITLRREMALAGTTAGLMGAAITGAPFLVLAAAISGVIFLFADFGTKAATAAAEMERFRQQANESKAELDRQKTALASVEEFMGNVVNRSRLLNTSQEQLNLTIEEARARFGSLSEAIHQNISSYGQLIERLKEVRGELALTMSLRAQEALQSQELLVGQLRQRADAPLEGRQLDIAERAFGINGRDVSREADRILRERGLGTNQQTREVVEDAEREAMRRLIGQRTGGDDVLQRAFGLLQGGVTGRPDELNAVIAALNQRPAGQQRDLLLELLTNRSRAVSEFRVQSSQLDNLRRDAGLAQFQTTDEFRQIADTVILLGDALARFQQLPEGSSVGDRRDTFRRTMEEYQPLLARVQEMLNALSPEQRRNFERSPAGMALVTAQGRVGGFRRELLEASHELTNVRAGANRTAAQSGFQASSSEIRSADTVEDVRRLAALAEQQAREVFRATVESVTAQIERDRPARDIAEARTVAGETEAADELTRNLNSVRQAARERATSIIRDEVRTIDDELRTLTQRGRARNPAQISSLRGRRDELLRQARDEFGLSENNLLRAQQRDQRADFSRYSRSTDPRLAIQDNFRSRLSVIEQSIRNDELSADIEPRRIRAQLDAARRVPGRFPQGYLIGLEEQLNNAEIVSQAGTAEAQRRRIQELTGLRGEIEVQLNEYGSRLRTLGGDRAAPGEEVNELRDRIQTLTGLVGRIDELRRNADISIAQADAVATARSGAVTGDLTDALRDAQRVIQRDLGLADSGFKQFSDSIAEVFRDASRSTGAFFYQFATGAKSAKDAARDMTIGILQSVAQIASNKLASMLLNAGINLLLTSLGGGSFGATDAVLANGSVTDSAGNALPFYNGGILKARSGALTRRPDIGRDFIPALLAGGEAVLNRRAVSLMGEETISELNAGRVRAQPDIPVMPMKREPDEVNVWLVAPNEKPTLGPRDVLAVIGQDVLTGGATKQLIKQVAMGAL